MRTSAPVDRSGLHCTLFGLSNRSIHVDETFFRKPDKIDTEHMWRKSRNKDIWMKISKYIITYSLRRVSRGGIFVGVVDTGTHVIFDNFSLSRVFYHKLTNMIIQHQQR